MPLIDLSPYEQANGEVTDPVKVTSAFSTIQTAMNGLQNVNFLGGANIDPLKLALPGSTNTWLRGDGTFTSAAANTVYFGRNTTVTVVNTVTGVDLFGGTVVIPKKSLGATGLVELWASGRYLNNDTGNAHTITFELKLGTTSIWKAFNLTPIGSSIQERFWVMNFEMQALASTAKQRISGLFWFGDNVAASTGFGVIRGDNQGSTPQGGPLLGVQSTVSMSSEQLVTLTASHDSANPNLSVTSEFVWMTITN